MRLTDAGPRGKTFAMQKVLNEGPGFRIVEVPRSAVKKVWSVRKELKKWGVEVGVGQESSQEPSSWYFYNTMWDDLSHVKLAYDTGKMLVAGWPHIKKILKKAGLTARVTNDIITLKLNDKPEPTVKKRARKTPAKKSQKKTSKKHPST